MPKTLVKQNPKLATYFYDGRQHAQLLDIESEIGHIFVHYLYTGQYELTGFSVFDVKEEYRRNVLTYKASLSYGIPKLEEYSKQNMCRVGRAITIFDVLRVASQEYSNIQPYTIWYAAYLQEMVTAAFAEDKDIFVRGRFSQCLGSNHCFLIFMMQIMNNVYSHEMRIYTDRIKDVEARAIQSSSNPSSCQRCARRPCTGIQTPESSTESSSLVLRSRSTSRTLAG